jgi:sortase (surface protein transpeptidase)
VQVKIKLKQNLGLILICLGIAGFIACLVLLTHHNGAANLAVINSKNVGVDPAPSSKKISKQTVASYTVPQSNPKYIAIPSIGISNTPIVKLGLLKSGAIATPDNIYEAGWYEGSSLPGQNGAMFIYAHVSSWTANGLFYNLKKLVAGNEITITRGDNKTYTYKVVESKVYPYNDVNMSQVLSPISSQTAGLNLMTCTGQVIKGTNEFNERLVVFTSLVS